MIRPVTLQDAKAIVDIYNHYILNSVATFEVDVLGTADMEKRLKAHDPAFPWIVLENDGVQGYAYATSWKTRAAYRRTAEVSVYVKHDFHGKGIGSGLYRELIEMLRQKAFHALLGGISLPNKTSVILHEKFGFKKVAHLKEVGFKNGDWRDVGYWELIL